METDHQMKNPSDLRADRAHESAAMGSKIPRVRAKKYRSFEDARAFAVTLNLHSRKQWRDYVKGEFPATTAKPADVPAHPDGIYKTKGWQGWRHWLGTEKAS
jgi:hypothetical protein